MPTDTETQRLQERVEDLERELRRRRRDSYGRGRRTSSRRARNRTRYYSDDYNDLWDNKIDEMSTLVRGVFRAGIEAFRTVTDSASRFSEEVLEDNEVEPGDEPRDTFRRLPGDMVSASIRAMDRSLSAPRRAVDQFDETYRSEPRRREVRRRRDDDYSDWSTSSLRREARDLDIDDYWDLSREELLAELEPSGGRSTSSAAGPVTRPSSGSAGSAGSPGSGAKE
jgi:hypothetical protein